MRYLGSWTILCDVAGQVTRHNTSPLVTVAAVAVPPEVRDRLRSRLVRTLGGPVKWAYGGLDGLQRVLPLVGTFSLPVVVRQVHRETPEAWQKFWADGDSFVKRLEEVVGDRTRYLASNATLKIFLYVAVFGVLVGKLLVLRGVQFPRVSEEMQRIDLTVVNDMDIQDEETRRLFAQYVEDWPNVTGFMAEIAVDPHTTVRFAHEQDEPLLLLPDYFAGAFHHADSRAQLAKPVAPPDAVKPVLNAFRDRHGDRLVVQDDSFGEKYPLDFRGNTVARRV